MRILKIRDREPCIKGVFSWGTEWRQHLKPAPNPGFLAVTNINGNSNKNETIASSYWTGAFFLLQTDGEKHDYYSIITITVGDQASFHHPLQGAKSLDVVSFDEESSCTIPESMFLDFYLVGSHESLTSLILMKN